MSTGLLGLIMGALLGAWVLVVGVCRFKRETDPLLKWYAELLTKTAPAHPGGSDGEPAWAKVPPVASKAEGAPPRGG
jgi:hypothetical protein